MDWIVSPKIHVETLTPNVTVFGEQAFMEIFKIKWGHNSEDLAQ